MRQFRDKKKVEEFLITLEKEGAGLDIATGEAIETMIPYGGISSIASHICLEIEKLKNMYVDYDRFRQSHTDYSNALIANDIKMQADYIRQVLEYTFKKFTVGYATFDAIGTATIVTIARGIDFFYVSYPTLAFLESVSMNSDERRDKVNATAEFNALYQSILAILFDISLDCDSYNSNKTSSGEVESNA